MNVCYVSLGNEVSGLAPLLFHMVLQLQEFPMQWSCFVCIIYLMLQTENTLKYSPQEPFFFFFFGL